jgi:hypothetical protein
VIFGSPANLLCEDIGAELPEREDVKSGGNYAARYFQIGVECLTIKKLFDFDKLRLLENIIQNYHIFLNHG